MDTQDVFKFLSYISSWEPQTDVLALKYYIPITATSAALCGSSINKYFRKAVKLKGQGFISTFLPIVILPAVIGSISHTLLVIKPMLTDQVKPCPVCLELRSGFIAVLTGAVYPGILAPISAFVNAERYYTYALPSPVKEPMASFKEALRLYKPFLPKFGTIALIQLVVGMALLHFEERNFHTVLRKTSEMESYLREKQKIKEDKRF